MFGKTILKWVMMAANLLAAFVMVITLLGTVISPEKFLIPAYFTLAFPIIIIVNIAFVLIWFVARKWLFLISLSILLISGNYINDTFPFHFGKTEAPKVDQPVTILTYNTKMSGELKKHTQRKPNDVMQYILDCNADIVCLQEFTVSKKDEYLTHKDIFKIFRKYPYKHIEYKYIESSKQSGVATFSKYPILNKQVVNFPSEYNVTIYSDININGKTVRLFNNHLESNKLTEKDKVMPISLKDDFNAENLSGVTTQFSRKLGAAYIKRAIQADAVAKAIQSSPYNVIVCGDFNDVPASYAYSKIKGELRDAFTETSTGFGWTFHEKFYRFRIDFVLYDSIAFSPINYRSDKVDYSDHYPVVCELNIKN